MVTAADFLQTVPTAAAALDYLYRLVTCEVPFCNVFKLVKSLHKL